MDLKKEVRVKLREMKKLYGNVSVSWIQYKYQPERSKREDLCFCEYCEEEKSKDKILGFLCKQCMQEM